MQQITTHINYALVNHTIICEDKWANPRYLQDSLRHVYAKFLEKIVLKYNETYLSDFLIDIESLRQRVTSENILAMPDKEMSVYWAVRRKGTELCIRDKNAYAQTDLERFNYACEQHSKDKTNLVERADWYPCVITIRYNESRDSFHIVLTQCFQTVE